MKFAKGIAILETALVITFIMPIIIYAYALVDFAILTSKINEFVDRHATDTYIKPLAVWQIDSSQTYEAFLPSVRLYMEETLSRLEDEFKQNLLCGDSACPSHTYRLEILAARLDINTVTGAVIGRDWSLAASDFCASVGSLPGGGIGQHSCDHLDAMLDQVIAQATVPFQFSLFSANNGMSFQTNNNEIYLSKTLLYGVSIKTNLKATLYARIQSAFGVSNLPIANFKFGSPRNQL